MAVPVLVQSPLKQIIVPVRFGRAVSNVAPVLDAPDVDDRGFVLKTPNGLNKTDARGAMFGITVGDTVRVKVVREDLDTTAPLFVTAATSSNPQVEITGPSAGGPLPSDGIFSIHARADNTTPQKIMVRLGSATGPVIAEADPHVFSLSTLIVTPHVWTLHAASSGSGTGLPPTVNGSAIDIGAIFTVVNTIWRPAGVRIHLNPTRNDTLFGTVVDNSIISDKTGPHGSDADLVDQNFAPDTCNIHFIPFTPRYGGRGIRNETQALVGFKKPGIIIGVQGARLNDGSFFTRLSSGAALLQELGNDVAHEIGHFLTLTHADNRNSDNPLTDTYGRRQLMHPFNLLPSSTNTVARFDDIGYGVVGVNGHRGCLILMKNHTTNASLSEVISVRRRFSSPNLYKPA